MDNNILHAILHLAILSSLAFGSINSSPDNMVDANSTTVDDNSTMVDENSTESALPTSHEITTAAPSFTTVWNYYGSTNGVESTANPLSTSTPHYTTSQAPTYHYTTGYPYTTAHSYYPYTTTSRYDYSLNRTKSYNYTTTPYPYTTSSPYTTYYPYMRTPYYHQPTSPSYYNPYHTGPYPYHPAPPVPPYIMPPHNYGGFPSYTSLPKSQTNFITHNAPAVYRICYNCRILKLGSTEEEIDNGQKNETQEAFKNHHDVPQMRYNDHVW